MPLIATTHGTGIGHTDLVGLGFKEGLQDSSLQHVERTILMPAKNAMPSCFMLFKTQVRSFIALWCGVWLCRASNVGHASLAKAMDADGRQPKWTGFS